MTVNCVDDLPVAQDDSAQVTEGDGADPIDVRGNDMDVDGGPMKVNSATDGDHGSVVVTDGGNGLSYTLDNSYCDPNDGTEPPANPSDTFTYTLNGGSIGHVTVDITCTDDEPVAQDDTVAVHGNSGATPLSVLTNDTDVDAGPKTIDSTLTGEPGHGTVVVAGNGLNVTYQPEHGYCGDDSFGYKLVPGGSSATVDVTVDCSDPPTAVNDAATVAQGAPATTLLVLANDFDTDGGPMSISFVTQPANGTVVRNSNGSSLTYQPNPSYCNDGSPTDNFTYTLDGGPSATVFMTVTCAAKPPTTDPGQQTTHPVAKKCKKGQKRVKGKCKKKKKKRKHRK
jgi:VCBS repeat-containing protein